MKTKFIPLILALLVLTIGAAAHTGDTAEEVVMTDQPAQDSDIRAQLADVLPFKHFAEQEYVAGISLIVLWTALVFSVARLRDSLKEHNKGKSSKLIWTKLGIALIIAIVLISIAGLFTGERETSSHSVTESTSAMEHAEESEAHSRDELMEWPDELPPVSLALEISKDDVGGWNVRLVTDSFEFAPEHASGDHVPREGHAHLYVNGEKIARVYSEWFHIGSLPGGENVISATLNANSHEVYAVEGEKIEPTVTVMVEGEQEAMHDHS